MNDQGQHFDPYGGPAGRDFAGHRAAHPESAAGPGPEQHNPTAPDVDVLDPSWDFEAELAQLLRDSAHPAAPAPPDGGLDEATRVLRRIDADHAPAAPPGGVSKPPPVRPPADHRRRRRSRGRSRGAGAELSWLHLFSFSVAALTAGIVAMVSVLGGLVSYDPLRHLAGPSMPGDLARWWPLLVYGPWLAASLSILRATVLRRRVRHSWAVVVLFSTIAVVLCVAHAPKTLSGVAAAGLPPITALACFHQLVGQITLTQPRHALPRHPAALPRRHGLLARGRTAHRGSDRD
ncbi:MAG TPA: DUF2637 domain-containing protein [Streptomyces sp.]|nr:DUF2637 domain-containing protein [Streptomyces sp.]